jgi:hypothetical protein
VHLLDASFLIHGLYLSIMAKSFIDRFQAASARELSRQSRLRRKGGGGGGGGCLLFILGLPAAAWWLF